MSDYTTVDYEGFKGASPSGLAIFVTIDGVERSIPLSCIDQDAFKDEGELKVATWFVEKTEWLGGGPEGSGLVLKRPPRARVSPPKYTISEKQLARMVDQATMCTVVAAHPTPAAGYLYDANDDVVAICDTSPEESAHNSLFLGSARAYVLALIDEVRMLRAWASKVTGGKGK